MSSLKSFALSLDDLRRGRDRSVTYDWAMRFPVIVYCSFVLLRDVVGFWHQVLQHPGAFEQFDAGTVVAVLARVSQWMFVLLLSIQPLFRLRAIAKYETILPRVVALTALSVPLMFMLIERAPADLAFNLIAVFLSLFANAMLVVTASFLGRSLSVMPEARRLVLSGPYSMVRHPLYLFEMLGMVAVALQYRSPAAAALLLAAATLQVARARWEEAVLARTFPDFAVYRSRTPFMVPRDPVHFLASFLLDPVIRRRSALVVGLMVAVLTLMATVLPRLII